MSDNDIQVDDKDAQSRYFFGDFVLDIERGALLRDGTDISLRPKTFEVLLYLVQHHGSLITRTQLHDAIWPNVVVSDESLTQCLAEIRKALDDSSHEMIRTVPRRGYLFDVPVTQSETAKEPDDAGKPDSEVETSPPGRKLVWGFIGLLFVTVALLVVDRWVLNPEAENSGAVDTTPAKPEFPEQRDARTLAVLPFINRSANIEDEYFTGGMHDELLTRLSRISALKVISRTSVMRYEDTQMSIPEIAEELKVGTIIEGGVQRSANQLRINVQVINANTDEHIWSEIYDRELTAQSLFAVQSEITSAIANALKATLTPEEESRIFDLPTANLEAYNHYLRGRQLMSREGRTDLERALEAFELATELDPEFALAWVGVADVMGSLIWMGVMNWDEDMDLRQQAAETALSLNDQLGEAYTSLASVYRFRNERDKEQEAYLKAIELSPSYAQAYQWYASSLGGWDNREKRLQLTYKAAQLDPLSLSVQLDLAQALGRVDRDDEARQVIQATLDREPNFARGHEYLGQMESNNGNLALSIEHFKNAMELDPGNGPMMVAAAMQYLALGDFEAVADIRADMISHLGEDNPQVVLLDHEILQAQANWPLAIDRMNQLPPNATSWHSTPWRTSFLYWSAEQHDKALESLLQWQPNVLDPEAWEKGAGGTLAFNCVYASILIGAGEEVLGRQLLRRVIDNIEQIPEADRVDRASPRSMAQCYMTAGDFDRGIELLESNLPGHSLLWTSYYWRHWPSFKQLEGTPRYDALLGRIEAILAEQRMLLGKMEATNGTKP